MVQFDISYFYTRLWVQALWLEEISIEKVLYLYILIQHELSEGNSQKTLVKQPKLWKGQIWNLL